MVVIWRERSNDGFERNRDVTPISFVVEMASDR
jgi:hypothetical protein